MKQVKKQLWVPLHNHTEYSFLDSIVKVKGLGLELKKKGFTSYAITDHGNINGTYAFDKELRSYGVKPILGCEFYYSFDRHRKGLTDEEKEKYLKGLKGEELKEKRKEVQKELGVNERFHVVVLAKNPEGFRKLIRAVELSHVEGFYRFPRIDSEILYELSPDCIVLTACVGGIPAKLCEQGRYGLAEKWCQETHNVFGDDFYMEIQSNEMPEQVEANKNIIRLANKFKIPLVATNDVHYLKQEDWETHDVLLALRDSQYGNPVYVDTEDRFRYTTRSLYLKTTQEMGRSFKTFHPYISQNIWKQALLNTRVIADKIEDDVITRRHGVLPNVQTYKYSADEYLMELIKQGWVKKGFNKKLTSDEIKVYQDRVKEEYSIIVKLGFSKYFLVVHDLIKWAKKNGIRVGPGRGSVGGSIIAYLIGITAVDSIKWKCPFSRFISEKRNDYPDIDIDFPGSDRERIKQYLREKYGSDQVAGICNFNRMKAKQTLKDVAKVHRVPFAESNEITKQLISRDPGEDREFNCIEDSINVSKEFKGFADKYPDVVRHSCALEGICRQLGSHAAGVVVTDRPVRDMSPVQLQRRGRSNNSGDYITGWDKRQVEEIGLIKLDILGIDALSYIQRTLDLIRLHHGDIIEPEEFENFDDPEVWQAFQEGYTELVWQLNQPSAIRLLKKLRPEKLEHIVAANALLRPGPLTSGITDEYIRRRHGDRSHESLHPKLDEILEDTYGMMVFQEDVTNISMKMAGFSGSKADELRKAIGKKRIDKINKLKEEFINGFINNDYKESLAQKIFEQIQEFSRYGFNRAHSLAYSLLSYWTMYFKIKYPLEFISAALEVESNDSKRRLIIREGRRLGVKLVPPDLNKSDRAVTIDYDNGVILSGFNGVKGIGESALDKLFAGRPYKTFQDFVYNSGVNKSVVSSLLKIGALDGLVQYPKSIEENLENILHVRKLKRQEKYWREKVLPIMAFCDKKYTQEEKDMNCLELLALPPDNHITNKYKELLKKIKPKNISDVSELFEHEYSSNYEWFVVSVNEHKVFEDGDKRSARLVIEDESGQITIGVPQNVLEKVGIDNVESGNVLLIAAKSFGFEKLKAGYIQNIKDGCGLGFMDFDYEGTTLTYHRGNKRVPFYIMGIDIFKTRKGDYMACLCSVDKVGNIRDVILWPSDFRNYYNKFDEDIIISCIVNAKKDLDRDTTYAVNINRQRGGGKVEFLGGVENE